MKLSEKIKLLRTAENLTQPELADKAGIEQSYLSKLENDKGSPSFTVINKIAQAFGLTGMELINSLNHTYIEQNLSHIPEVAAEYASVKKRQAQLLKRRFLMASLTVILGIGVYFMGMMKIVFPETEYIYQSLGVIKDNETIYQFYDSTIDELNETRKEAEARIKANRDRIDIKLLTMTEYPGYSFVKKEDGGRRRYVKLEEKKLSSKYNDMVSILGVMQIVAGVFMFIFTQKFKDISSD